MSETAVQPHEDNEPPQETPAAPPEPPSSEAAKRTMALALSPTGAVVVTRFQEQWDFASATFKQGVLGPGIKTVGQAWVLMQRGAELGFPLMTACEYLYIVKGRIRMTPDGAKAKAQSSGLLVDFKESYAGTPGEDDFRAVCWVKRRGQATPIEREFSIADARTARLWGKSDSAWQTYPKRMLAARARGYAFADAFRDVCGGLQIREMFDLDPGERIGGDVPLPPEVQRLTARTVDPEAKPARVSFSAPLVVDAEVVPEKTVDPEDETGEGEFTPIKYECGCPITAEDFRRCPKHGNEKLWHDEAPEEPVTFDRASAEASIRAECSKRTGGDLSAANDLFREACSSRFGALAPSLETEEDYDSAMAAIRAHPAFGDEDGPPVLTSPKAEPKKGGKW